MPEFAISNGMQYILPAGAKAELARETYRLHHYLWHGVRSVWEALTDTQRRAILTIQLGWAPPRPGRDSAGNILLDNNSGEDFLFMHRRMIGHLNALLAAEGQPQITGWNSIPGPDDPDYPVPDFPIFTPQKTVEFWKECIVGWEALYSEPAYLRSISLGRLGAQIEFGIHNAVHNRWKKESPVGYRPASALSETINARW
ncbi:MAG: Tat pathway signal protein, partial [Candidatus Solibacter sp.]